MKNYLALAISFLMLMSCESYLDQTQATEELDDSDVFGSYYNMKRYLEDGYTKLFNCDAVEMFSQGKNHTHLAQYSDEASTNKDRISEFKGGSWMNFFDRSYNILGDGENGWVEFTAPYVLGFQGIRIANRTIEQINTPTDITDEQKDQLLGQAYLIRAMCYFQILERWGGMPYFTSSLDINKYLGFSRLTYHETSDNIVKDCDLAFEHLPLEWDSENTGRPAKSTALALKSRVLLYAASKTYNTSNDISLWEDAAKAADAAIKFVENEDPYYELLDASNAINAQVSSKDDADYAEPEIESIMDYRKIFLYETRSPEVLFSVYRENVRATGGDKWQRFTVNVTYYNSPTYLHKVTYATSLSPNENFVELFETKNGLDPFDDLTYDKHNPYVNRDPRFYNTIIYNGVNWPLGKTDHIVELYNEDASGKPGADRITSTSPYPHTGYMMRKYWSKGASTSGSVGGEPYVELIIPYFRVAELYLNYAEAAFEASGRSNINASYSGDDAAPAYNAVTSLNRVRNRVGMPDLNAQYQNTTDLMDRIRNERSIELCFENGHRWFDLLRWNELDKVEKTYGAYLEYNADADTYPTGYKFSKYEIETLKKTFTERNYFYPVDPDEVNQYPEFEQNPGW